ncbi:DUF5655 domain-containing protein [Pedobacter metabolipauper]|uniref:DUF5655 domain-containing protein n=1 Tax=Pedobacter metabolipauper TaxID=425513 RepID=A0A4R6SY27_9SPHI|nr:DUF5655 domain-containing protein [Pedobacter metabolipauper]TDQ10386.1 hypothetical protein ATK78_2552 [Pedobacter metabolipauper]
MDNPDQSLDYFLQNKSPHTIELFNHFIETYQNIGAISIRPAKTMIMITAKKSFAYVIQLGKDFIDIVLPFKQPYEDNLCFRKIKQVPNTDDYNHHLRLYYKEDINEEVLKFMEMAYRNGSDLSTVL